MATRFLVPFSSSRAPFGGEPMFELHREMNRLFDDFFRGFGPGPGAGGSGPGGASFGVPRLDVRETADELCMLVDVPGVARDDIDLRLDGDTLTISGERRQEAEPQTQDYHLMERSYGRFQRSVQLPFTPDPGRVQARFDNGVLTVRMPRQAEAQRSHRIPVGGGDAVPGAGGASGAGAGTGAASSTAADAAAPGSGGHRAAPAIAAAGGEVGGETGSSSGMPDAAA